MRLTYDSFSFSFFPLRRRGGCAMIRVMKKALRVVWMWVLFAAALSFGQMPEGLGAAQLTLQVSANVQTYAIGKDFLVEVRGEITSGWHAYYRNPGSVGEAMTAQLTAPAGFAVKGPYWQVPKRIESEVGTLYGYEAPVILWQITPQENAPEQADFEITTTAQLCSGLGCQPPTDSHIRLHLTRGDATANPAWSKSESGVEILGDSPVRRVSATRAQLGYELTLNDPGFAGDPLFISDDNAVHPAQAQKVRREAGKIHLQLPANTGEDTMYPAPEKKPLSLKGHLIWPGGQHASVAVPLQSVSHGIPAGFWEIALGLFLGGMLLNLMPCVFPVLGLKVMSFVQLSGGSRGRVIAHSLTFVLGILVSFVLLGMALIAVSNLPLLADAPWQEWAGILIGDEGGADRSWATWMQNNWVVYALMVLLLVLGLGMYGIFEIGVSATAAGQSAERHTGLTGAFLQGLFVTLVATPCSAPFLGAAMPAAMALPGLWLLASLFVMGLGLGIPYIVLSLFPGLVDLLPRPGQWMESLKQGLSFLMLAAAAWLLDVYLSTRDTSLSVLLGLVIICAACWVYGRWCALYRSKLSRISGLVISLFLAVAGVYYSMPESASDEPSDTSIEWVTWSPAAMQEALDDGSPVFVDFTAKWCTTCLANKGIAYSEDVRRLFNQHNVVLMRADKTLPNPKIDAEMRRLERSSVPTNALYIPGKEPIVTRELLTPGYLLDFLKSNLPPAE